MSGTLIDALTVELALDPSKFVSGAEKAKRQLRDLPEGIERIDKSEAKAAQEQQKRGRETDRAAGQSSKDAIRRHKDQQREVERQRAADTKSDNEATREKAKVQSAVAKQNKEAWSGAKEAALGFSAALAGAVTVKYFTDTASGVADLGRSAHNLGLATPTVKAWANAVETVGGNAAAAIGSLQGLQKGLVGLRTGDQSILGPLNEIGVMSGHPIGVTGPDGHPIDEVELLKRVAEATKGMDPSLRAVELGKLGLDPGTMNAMQGGRSGMDAAMADAMKRGVASNAEATQDAKLQAEATKLEQAFRRLGETLVFKFGPDVLRLMADLGSALALATGKISVGEFWQERKEHQHDANVQELIGSGMTPFDAEAKARQAEASGRDPTASTAPNRTPGLLKGLERFLQMPAGGVESLPAALPHDIETEVRKDAIARGVDPDHMVALFRQEQGGYNKVSSMGAFGPAQLMPATARMAGAPDGINAPGYDWRQNVATGIRVWAGLQHRFKGNAEAADAAYNAGPGGAGVSDFASTGDMSGLPRETYKYVTGIRATLAARPAAPVSASGDTNTSTTHIDKIEVHAAANANAIASGMKQAIGSHPLIGHSVE